MNRIIAFDGAETSSASEMVTGNMSLLLLCDELSWPQSHLDSQAAAQHNRAKPG